MSYNRRDFREEPPTRKRSHPVITVTISVTITLSLVITAWFIFGNRLSVNGDSPTPTPGITPVATTVPQGNTPGTIDCLGYEKTDPEVPDQGKKVTFPVTVPKGCDVIVQGVVGQNIGPYNWNNGAVAALGPGSYTFTITDGSYQMSSDANAKSAYCNAINWIQTNGKALSEVYPLPGWGNC